jgi:hypothetical protein
MEECMQQTTWRLGLLATTLLICVGEAATAQTAPIYDPGQLPAFHGKVAQYDLSFRGGLDGVILADGTEVHTPRRLEAEFAAAVKPGDTITIHGLKARELKLVQAVSLTNDATAKTLVDVGQEDGTDNRRRSSRSGTRTPSVQGDAQGTIKMPLHDARGEVDGVLLQDGTIVHLPPASATRLASILITGKPLFARGDVNASTLGKVINASAIGPAADQLTDLPHTERSRRGSRSNESR